MPQDDLSAASQLRLGRRSAYRFDIAAPQLMALTAVLVVLALLLFLGGLAIGLLLNPRWTTAGSPLPTAVVSRPVETPPAPRQTYQRRPEEPPKQRFRIAQGARARAAAADWVDKGIVWQPRNPTSGRSPSAASPSVASPSAASQSAVSHSLSQPTETHGPEGQLTASLPTAEPSSLSERRAVDRGAIDRGAIDRDAIDRDAVDRVYRARPTSSFVQPPSSWRRSQPLAVAYWTQPEGDVVAPSDDVKAAGPRSLGIGLEVASDGEPQTPAVDSLSPAPVVEPGTNGPSVTAAQRPSTGPGPVDGEDGGWRPTTSHWQSFVSSLASDTAGGARAGDAGLDVEHASSGSRSLAADRWQPKAERSEQAAAVARDTSPSDSSERSADFPAPDSTESGGDAQGWQPKSSLWRSYIDAPYDWTADRLPATQPPAVLASGSLRVPYGLLIDRVAESQGVEAALVAAMVQVESAFDAMAVSPRGARGLMQVMPTTASRFGIEGDQLFDPAVNLEVGARYLRWLQDRFGGDTERVLAAYNAGENAVDTYDGVPPYAETQDYVERIFTLMGWPRSAAP